MEDGRKKISRLYIGCKNNFIVWDGFTQDYKIYEHFLLLLCKVLGGNGSNYDTVL